MPLELGRRALLSTAVGGGWLGFSSRSLIGLHPRAETVADRGVDLRGISVLEPLGDRLLIGGPSADGLGFCLYSGDGELRWRRTYDAESADGDVRLDVTPVDGDGFLVVESGRVVHRVRGDGGRAWKRTLRPSIAGESRTVGASTIDTTAVGSNGHAYVAGSYVPEDSASLPSVERRLWLAKLDGEGRTLWRKSPGLSVYHTGDRIPSVPYFSATEDGLLAVLNGYQDGFTLRKVSFDRSGTVESESAVPHPSGDGSPTDVLVSLRRYGDRYVGTVRNDEEASGEGPTQFAVQFDRALASSSMPLGTRRVSDVAGLPDGGYFTAAGQSEYDSEYLDVHWFGPGGPTFWQERFPHEAGPVAAAVTSDRMAAAIGGTDPRLLLFEGLDGTTVTPLLALAGVGAGLTVAGTLREDAPDEEGEDTV